MGELYLVRKLQCVHSNILGLMPIACIQRRRYFVTFVNNYTRCCSVYFMKNNSEVFDKCKELELCTTIMTVVHNWNPAVRY